MKNLLRSVVIIATLLPASPAIAQKAKVQPPPIPVLKHEVAIHWFLDESTHNPAAFLDFYNGAAYTLSEAISHSTSVDAFCYDRSRLPSSFQEVDLVNMTNYGNGNFHVNDTFHAVAGNPAFTAYTTSTFSEVPMNPVAFDKIKYNSDIAGIWRRKVLNGGYADLGIPAQQLTDANKFYQFVAANGKRGFFHVLNANYLPGSTMTIEIKVER